MAEMPIPDNMAAPMEAVEAEKPPMIAPAGTSEAMAAKAQNVPMWDISGEKPALGEIPHDQVTEAVSSGRYTFPKGVPVPVFSPDGALGHIPPEDAPAAFQEGYSYAAGDKLDQYLKEQKYGSLGQQAIAGAEGLAKGVAGPLATAAEKALGVPTEDIEGRAEVNPTTHIATEIAGLAAPALLTGGESLAAKATMGGLLSDVGQAASQAAGLAEKTSALGRIGSTVTKLAAENAAFQLGDEASKMILHPETNPHEAIQTAAADIGLAGLIGGVIGAPLGAASPLWEAAGRSKMGQLLTSMANKMGGIEGAEMTSLDHAIAKTGIDVAPEIRATLNGDPEIQRMAKTLEQSDTTKAGVSYQEKLNQFKAQLGNSIATTLGKTPEELAAAPEFSAYHAGKNIGDTLAAEYETKMAPLRGEYDAYRQKYGATPLDASQSEKLEEITGAQSKLQKQLDKTSRQLEKAMKGNRVEEAVELSGKIEDLEGQLRMNKMQADAPGTADRLISQINTMAQHEGWATSPSSETMTKIRQVIKELPLQKNLRDLTSYASEVGKNFRSANPADLTLDRVGSKIKALFRQEEARILESQVGEKEGEAALSGFRSTQKNFAKVAEMKDAVDSRLRAKGSASNYAKSVREMANTDAEAVFRRLSGKGDADLLNALAKDFPETANAVRRAHVDQLLDASARKAKPGETFSSSHLINSLNNPKAFSPELKQFIMSPEQADKIEAVSQLLDQLHKTPHNFSNTARALDALMEHVPASAVGMIGAMASHNPAIGLVIGAMTKYLGRDIPDAARLGLLKFMGRGAPIESGGFKQMVDFIHATQKGESLTAKAVKNIFKADAEVLPSSAMPKDSDKAKLDKALRKIQTDPNALLDNQPMGKADHYMPEHAGAMGEFTSNAVNYLNSIRPNVDRAKPLDSKRMVAPAEKAAFERALGIAQQPLVVLEHIKKGNITGQDVKSLRMMYPALYDRLAQKLTHEMTEMTAQGKLIPYKTRMGLSLFLGEPLDSTMTPQAILAAQPKPEPAPAAQQPGGGKGTAKGGSALQKLSESYQTPTQAAERNRTKK